MAKKTVASKAQEMYEAFELRERDNGEKFYALADGAPEWMGDVCREAHGDMFPDDWRYEAIHAAVARISEASELDTLDDLGHEFADGYVDIYNGERFRWLASHLDRAGYCDEAQEQGLAPEGAGVTELIGLGQYVEALEVFELVVSALALVEDGEG